MKSFTAAMASLGMIASPVLAEASTSSLPRAGVPATEQVEGLQALPSYGWWIIGGLLFGGAILLLVLNDDDDDDEPASP